MGGLTLEVMFAPDFLARVLAGVRKNELKSILGYPGTIYAGTHVKPRTDMVAKW